MLVAEQQGLSQRATATLFLSMLSILLTNSVEIKLQHVVYCYVSLTLAAEKA